MKIREALSTVRENKIRQIDLMSEILQMKEDEIDESEYISRVDQFNDLQTESANLISQMRNQLLKEFHSNEDSTETINLDKELLSIKEDLRNYK